VFDSRFTGARGNLVGGQWTAASTGKTISAVDPATGDVIGSVPRGGATEIDNAVRAARENFTSGAWSRAAPSHRGQVLWSLAAMVRALSEELAALETRDSGKPISESREDVAGVADILEYFAGMATKIAGQTMQLPNNQLGLVLREPIGVVGCITPWNFPMYVATWKVAPALACGNSVVLKPSSLASLTCLALGELALEAGVPDGTLNVVCGTGEEAGLSLAQHADVDFLAFTGSTAVGRTVMAARSALIRPVQVELGGKSANIVFGDANLDAAAKAAAFGIFYTQGENCNAGSRILVEDGIAAEFTRRVAEIAEDIRVLPPLDERSQLGSLISPEQLAKVSDYVNIGVTQGAELVVGGERLKGPTYDSGSYFPPTILANVGPTDRVFQEEIFGPVVTVTTFRDESEAIALANATDYGLAAGVWTSNLDRAFRCAQRIASGYVWINTFNTTPVEAPFGGVKASGFGRDCGSQAIDNYLTWKTIALATEPYVDWYEQA
jgi:acyl-CoA reductase-like NAD-dependent aldehyde dehydrogenase